MKFVAVALFSTLALATEVPRLDTSSSRGDNQITPPIPSRNQDSEKLNFLSATLGSHMVLQRAPQQAVVWGFTQQGSTVTTTMQMSGDNAPQTFSTVAGPDGTWRQKLPATPASKNAYSLEFSSDSALKEKASMSDVLFGE